MEIVTSKIPKFLKFMKFVKFRMEVLKFEKTHTYKEELGVIVIPMIALQQ
jgi:hypothetical protein